MWRCCATRRAPGPKLAVDAAAATRAPAAKPSDDFGFEPLARAKAVEKKGLVESFQDEVLTDGFWDKLETRVPFHVPGALPQLNRIMDLDSVISALARGSETGSTAAFKRGEPYMRESFYIAYLDSASLSLTDAERYFPALLDLCQGLAPKFGYVTARMVLQPPSARSHPHVAEGDVFLLQVFGEQRLSLSPHVAGPVRVTAPRPQPLLACNLGPGDVVFVPTGMECRTEGVSARQMEGVEGGPVLSVLLTVRTSEHSLGMSLGKYMNDVLRESLAESSDSFFRSAVTKTTLPDRYPNAHAAVDDGAAHQDLVVKRSEVEARLRAAVADLSSKLRASALHDHFEQRMETLRQAQRDGAMKTPSKDPLPRNVVLSHSRVRVSRGVSCKCVAGETIAHFKRGSETLSLPIERSASYLISELCNGRPRVVSTLPCQDEVERLCVCQILVFKECFEVVDEDDYSNFSDRVEPASAYSGSF